MNEEEKIRIEIVEIERKRERAIKDKCPFVAKRHQREIDALLSELNELINNQ